MQGRKYAGAEGPAGEYDALDALSPAIICRAHGYPFNQRAFLWQAYFSGRLKVSGDLGVALDFADVADVVLSGRVRR